MDENQIVVVVAGSNIHDAVANGILPVHASENDVFELGNMVLAAIRLQNGVPTLDTDHFDAIDVGMVLKRFQCIHNDGLIVDIEELLGDLLPHTLSRTARKDQCDVHSVTSSPWISFL